MSFVSQWFVVVSFLCALFFALLFWIARFLSYLVFAGLCDMLLFCFGCAVSCVVLISMAIFCVFALCRFSLRVSVLAGAFRCSSYSGIPLVCSFGGFLCLFGVIRRPLFLCFPLSCVFWFFSFFVSCFWSLLFGCWVSGLA